MLVYQRVTILMVMNLPRSSAVVLYLEKVFFATSRLDAGIFQCFFNGKLTMENHHAINGKIHYFYGNFQ
jgi:hypothetical protein